MRIYWTIRLSTALVWAAAAASATYWGLQLSRPSSGPVSASIDSPVSPSASEPAAPASLSALSSFLGAPAEVDASSNAGQGRVRYTLIGVVAEGADGAALIASDGQPPRPYRVGWALDDNTILQSVGPSHAVLGSKAGKQPMQRLEMPPPRTPE